MEVLKYLASLFKSIPAVASLFEKWIELQEKKLPMKVDKHDERKPVREVDAKWDAERRDDKGKRRNLKRDKKYENKRGRNKSD